MPRRESDERDSGDGTELIGGNQTVVPANKQPNPFVEFQGWNKEEVRRFLRLAAKLVRFVDHWEYDEEGETKKLSVERFMAMANLAVLDLFSEMEDRERAHLCNVTPDVLVHVRAHPAFALISDDIAAKLAALRDGRGLEALAPFFESSAAMETAQTMFFATKPRDRDAAAAQFMDRTAPKKTRGEGNTLIVMMPPGQEETMQRTLDIMQRTFQPDPAISAKRVRVPELPPAPER